MSNEPLYFATDNNRRFDGLHARLSDASTELRWLNYSFTEDPTLGVEKNTEYKLSQAKKAFPGKKLVVDNYFLHPSNTHSFAVGYFDGEKNLMFITDEDKTIRRKGLLNPAKPPRTTSRTRKIVKDIGSSKTTRTENANHASSFNLFCSYLIAVRKNRGSIQPK